MYRREVLRLMGNGFGMLALADSLRAAGQGPLAVKPPHFAARAKRVIFLFMLGGWSQVDTFDPKPALAKHHAEPMPGPKIKTDRAARALMRSPLAIGRFGPRALEVDEA